MAIKIPKSRRIHEHSNRMNATNISQLIGDHDHTKLVRLKQRDSANQVDLSTSEMIQLISEEPKAKRLLRRMPIQTTAVIVIIYLIVLAQNCACDTQTKRQQLEPSEPARSHHSERLYSSLADIERQHFKLDPVKSFENSYESRFTSTSTNSFNPSLHQQSPQASSVKKADDSMHHIMRMHERLASASSVPVTANHHPDPQQQVLNQHMMLPSPSIKSHGANSLGSTGNEKNQAQSWREFVKSPAKVASSLINPTKLVTQVISYVSPLVGSNLKLPMNLTSSSLTDDTLSVVSSGISRARALNSYYGRALATKPSKLETSASRPSIISMPQNMFLRKPDSPEIREHKAIMIATQPTPTLMSGISGDSSFSLAKMAFRAAKKKLQPPSEGSSLTDLFTDSSLISNSVATKSSMGSTQEVSLATANSISPSASEGKDLPKSRASPQSGSWIKKQTNHYLQDSLRDLILLSQLPIMSGPISTAPSVLERGSKLYGLKKGGHNVTSSLGSGASSASLSSLFQNQGQGLKAIDEILRLAYILGTGVRRERDPLKALSTNSNPLSLANNMATAFSQRSLRQLLAPSRSISYNNGSRNSYGGLSTYAGDTNRRLKSILLAGLPKSAKPRGVIWDMATDPSLAVTVFHLIERASVALPLGEYSQRARRYIRDSSVQENQSLEEVKRMCRFNAIIQTFNKDY